MLKFLFVNSVTTCLFPVLTGMGFSQAAAFGAEKSICQRAFAPIEDRYEVRQERIRGLSTLSFISRNAKATPGDLIDVLDRADEALGSSKCPGSVSDVFVLYPAQKTSFTIRAAEFPKLKELKKKDRATWNASILMRTQKADAKS